MAKQKRTARLSLFPKTIEKLLSKKLKIQAQSGKSITWDEFLLEKCC